MEVAPKYLSYSVFENTNNDIYDCKPELFPLACKFFNKVFINATMSLIILTYRQGILNREVSPYY